MRRLEGDLKIRCDTDGPVKAVGIPGITTILFHQRHRFFHLTGHFCGIVNNNAVVTARVFAQRMHDKLVQHAEVVGALFRAGQDQRQNLIFVGRVHQDPEQIKQLFRRTYAAREDNNAVRDTDKRLKTFFDIRHNNQFVNQRVRRLSGDDRRLGHADKTAFFIALLRVTYCRAFHWCFHRARTATGTDIQFAQAELRPHAAGIQVFGFVNRVTTPADDHVRRFAHVQGAGVTQNGEDQVGDMNGTFQVKMLETTGVADLSVNKQDVAQHGKQVGLK